MHAIRHSARIPSHVYSNVVVRDIVGISCKMLALVESVMCAKHDIQGRTWCSIRLLAFLSFSPSPIWTFHLTDLHQTTIEGSNKNDNPRANHVAARQTAAVVMNQFPPIRLQLLFPVAASPATKLVHTTHRFTNKVSVVTLQAYSPMLLCE